MRAGLSVYAGGGGGEVDVISLLHAGTNDIVNISVI